jgi:hypothetical protein
LNAIQALSQLSYGPIADPNFQIPRAPVGRRAGPTGLEPATSGVTVRHSNRLSYGPKAFVPCRRRNLRCCYPRAGNRARTGDLNLGKVALYQLSYARKPLVLLRQALPRGVEPRSPP